MVEVWQKCRLRDLGRVITGRTPAGTKPEYFDGPIPFLTPVDMDGRRTVGNTARTLSKSGAAVLKGVIVSHGVAVSCIGWQMGKAILIDQPIATNQQINSILTDQSAVDDAFLYYSLLNRRDEIFQQGAGGSRTPILNKSNFEAIPIDLPPLHIQKAISAVLGALDDKIELNRCTNETLEAMAQAIFRDWFVDFGPTRRKLAGLTDPIKVTGGLVQDAARAATLAALFPATLADNGLPEGWVERPIGEIAEIVGGGTPSTKEPLFWNNGVHLWATPKDLSKLESLHLYDTERRITDAGLARVSSGLSPQGSVLLSSRAPIGYLALAEHPTAVNQGFIVIRPTKELPTSFALFWCRENMDVIKANANGSTFQEISKKNFRPLPVVVPGEPIVSAFVDLVEPMILHVRKNGLENQTLAATRDLLLPKLMSGEIRLRDAERTTEV